MELVEEALVNSITKLGFDRTYWIAFSGGMDSLVLLHACSVLASLYPSLKLAAIHVHHGLNLQASAWQQQCKELCKQYAIDFYTEQLTLHCKPKDSIEELAREGRYAVFAKRLLPNDVLLTAHHQDDQAETLLLQLIRGSGLPGLAAMPETKSLALGIHHRPFLSFSREDLYDYASLQQLVWIEDDSNSNKQYSRNFLRLNVLPELKKRWSTVTRSLSRSAEHCAEAQLILNELAERDLDQVQSKSDKYKLSIPDLVNLSEPRQRLCLRYWFAQLGFPTPSTRKLNHIQFTLHARYDRKPCVEWGDVQVRRFKNDLVALPLYDNSKLQQTYEWQTASPLPIEGLGVLHHQKLQRSGLLRHLPDRVKISFRQFGEVCRLPNRQGSKKLKKIFQELKIPIWQRERIPLIYINDELAVAVGLFVTAEFATREDEQGYLISVE